MPKHRARHIADVIRQENEVHRFPLMLLPLRPGYLLLPQVEVHPAMTGHRGLATGGGGGHGSGLSPRISHRPSSSLTSPLPSGSLPSSPAKKQPQDGLGVEDGRQISCETDYRNAGQTILAIPDVKGATVCLESGTMGGTARLMEVERRSTRCG
jgi:hypothetical protein